MSSAERRRGILRLLRASLRGRRRDAIKVVLWSLVAAVPVFLSGRLIAEAMDEGFLVGETETGLAYLGVLALSAVVGTIGMRQAYLVLARIVEPFRDELARLSIRGALWRSTRPGALQERAAVARLTQQVEIAREAYASVLIVIQSFAVGVVGATLGLLTLDPTLLLFVVPPVAVGLALFAAALPQMAARQRISILADEGLSEGTAMAAEGLRDITASGAEQVVADSVERHIEAQARATRELARFTAVRTIAVAIGGWLPIILILAAGPWLLRNGETTGTLLGAIAYVSQGIHGALQTLVRGLGNTGLWLVVSLGRIVEAIEGESPQPDAAAPAGSRGYSLRLENVTFGYGRSPQPIVESLDLTVPEGDHLTIVGPSGVGKSTLANLATGILEPTSGTISLGNASLSSLSAAELARTRVLIPQETYVFAGTLWENLTYLNPDASVADVDAALERLGARELVDRLGGYEGSLEGSRLSAGERQLVTLVRAYVSPAPLIVLDEATCHLDPRAEEVVEKAFDARPGTLIVIAHRISSALRARRILVMDGATVAVGSHTELLEKSPLYRDLVGHWGETELEPAVPPARGGRLAALWKAVSARRARHSNRG